MTRGRLVRRKPVQAIWTGVVFLKANVILLFGIILCCPAVEGQLRSVDSAQEYTEEEYFNDDDVRRVFVRYEDFVVDFSSPASYADEVMLFIKSHRGLATLVSIMWDTATLTVYQGRFPASISSIVWKATKFAAASETYKTFVSLVKEIRPSFFKEQTAVELRYYETEFVMFKRTEKTIKWALTAFNRREYKEARHYPGRAYESLEDFILMEFGSAP